MKDWTLIQERYLRDPLPIRLGGLAANLRRIQSFAAQESNADAVASLIDESKHFIEWTAPDAEVEAAAELAELQVSLARWQVTWTELWSDLPRRQALADQARTWSDRILARSGLVRSAPA